MIRTILRAVRWKGAKNTGTGWPGGWPGGWRSGPTTGQKAPDVTRSGLGWPTGEKRAK